ncbi:MAG TPA: DUF2027 domain-containing protein [Bacteroidales bacterium]|jgi:hypothetical protein|nr:DUF2027 domain-containing protein [Bacteroidales bacterium]HOL97067.1 DUF2027 domain-containing protein [Bacteroidales bacterium]HOM35976.1 DUF2027 domain-containing protein [Bacteroidales bacterium]HPD23410.1 DUF2027 domain-containing protein [Bacteroidales bacterium]HRS99422.1 DUF2027 domain-containing protein [Bacteroidales bacterium]
MKIDIGDKVRFLNDVGGGEVIKIISNNMVLVKDDTGFEYPYPANELVVIEKSKVFSKVEMVSENTVFNKTSETKVKTETVSSDFMYKNDNITNIFFAFTRVKNDSQDGFDIFLINDSDFTLYYMFFLKGDFGWRKLDHDILEPNTKIKIDFLSRDIVNKSQEIVAQILFISHPVQIYHRMIERKIPIVPLELFQDYRYKANEFLDENAYIFILLKEELGLGNNIDEIKELETIITEKEKVEEDKSARFKTRPKPKTIEVDLHINQLVDSVVGMSNAQILEIQMKKFHETMTEAIMNGVARVVFIHGIGNGTLKSIIRESIKEQYKLNYEDASFREYGFGATMVIME